MREEAAAIAEHCGGDLAVTSLAGEGSAVAQRTALATAGQLVVATPGRIAKVGAQSSSASYLSSFLGQDLSLQRTALATAGRLVIATPRPHRQGGSRLCPCLSPPMNGKGLHSCSARRLRPPDLVVATHPGCIAVVRVGAALTVNG